MMQPRLSAPCSGGKMRMRGTVLLAKAGPAEASSKCLSASLKYERHTATMGTQLSCYRDNNSQRHSRKAFFATSSSVNREWKARRYSLHSLFAMLNMSSAGMATPHENCRRAGRRYEILEFISQARSLPQLVQSKRLSEH